MREAQCACGGLVVKTTAEPKLVIMCHCLECQRRTGSPFGVSGYFDQNDVEISGSSTIYRRSSDSSRSITCHFCPTCGTTVHWRAEFVPELIGVAAGCFADPEFPAPARAVHVRRKHAWVAIPDDIPAIETQST